MAPWEPATWSVGTWVIWALAVYYIVNFFRHWLRFRRLEAAMEREEPGAVERYNDGIRGFPASGYAKMLGKMRRG